MATRNLILMSSKERLQRIPPQESHIIIFNIKKGEAKSTYYKMAPGFVLWWNTAPLSWVDMHAQCLLHLSCKMSTTGRGWKQACLFMPLNQGTTKVNNCSLLSLARICIKLFFYKHIILLTFYFITTLFIIVVSMRLRDWELNTAQAEKNYFRRTMIWPLILNLRTHLPRDSFLQPVYC